MPQAGCRVAHRQASVWEGEQAGGAGSPYVTKERLLSGCFSYFWDTLYFSLADRHLPAIGCVARW